ncbi:hypothetical protein OIDMADRAFT_183035 [Oidiodendron maius Zn]|uniref:Heterokaryon incompatibility domain-containing protein n=1 Tax=Oidiodendron maius (strain Zn) TaxID=913774 RepID=A0A0C3D505_OIDMZ|nr:hypothetical protein OIDMADRAFT_183035 [Oidiodendron maius Zn]
MSQLNFNPTAQIASGEVVIDLNWLPTPALSADGTPESPQASILLYKFLPLPPNNQLIRILDLDAPPGRPVALKSQALTGTLRVVSLSTCPRFAALSYVWGEYSFPPDVISCNNGANLKITANCKMALLALRRQFGALTIWVDAICINQEDAGEKHDQIPLMEEIYTWAQPVFVWLGPDDLSSRKSMKWLRKASSGSVVDLLVRSACAPKLTGRLGYKVAIISSIMGYMSHTYIDLLLYLIPIIGCLKYKDSKPPVRDIDSLFDRDWFRRIWTFQEVLLACDIVVVCGNTRLTWAQLMAGLDTFYKESSGSLNINTARELLEAWMKIPRSTHWKGKEKQRRLQDVNTAEAYRENGLKFVSQPLVYVPLKVWQLFVDAARGYTITYPAVIIIGLILESSRGVDFDILEVLMISAYFALIGAAGAVLIPWGNTRTFDRCRFSFRFGRKSGNPSLDNTSVIIQAIRERKSSEPRDHAYGTYGVLRRLGATLTKPDYSKPVGQVYFEFFLDLLRWDPTTIRLLLDTGWNQLPDTPSWVPDWNDGSLLRLKHEDVYYRGKTSETKPSPQLGGMKNVYPRPIINPDYVPKVSVQDNKLTVTAQWVEIVQWVSGPFGSIDIELFLEQPEHFSTVWGQIFWLVQWSFSFRRLLRDEIAEGGEGRNGEDEEVGPSDNCRTFSEAISTSEAVYSALSLPKDVWFDCRDKYERSWVRAIGYMFPAFVRIQNLDSTHRQEMIRDCICNNEDGYPWEIELRGIEPTGREALESVVEFINGTLVNGRRLFTANNGILGWTPMDTRVGDLVTMIEGVSRPLILRKVEGSTTCIEYNVIGHAFTHDEWVHRAERFETHNVVLV